MKNKLTKEDVKTASARYLKIVEWSDEDRCFVGRAPGLFFGGCHGDDERKVYAELCDLVEEHVKEWLLKKEKLPEATAGKEYSGKFNVRIGPELHQAVAMKAMAEGVSMNQVVAEALATSGPIFSSKSSYDHGASDGGPSLIEEGGTPYRGCAASKGIRAARGPRPAARAGRSAK